MSKAHCVRPCHDHRFLHATRHVRWRWLWWPAALFGLGGCALLPQPVATRPAGLPEVRQALAGSTAPSLPPAQPGSAPVPAPVTAGEPAALTGDVVQSARMDLVFNRAQARDVFLALVVDTPYSMTLHPDVSGQLSLTLRRVTLAEALDAIRDVYGYDWRVDGSRITVFPPAPQTRVFTVNYLMLQRSGNTEMSVSAGGITEPASTGSASGSASGTSGTSSSGRSNSASTQLSTASRSDLWTELASAVRTIVGDGPGRFVLVTPQAGMVTVRAMPDTLRQVESYLRSVRGALERQVMLEAKIIDIELSDGYQSGIDWTRLGSAGGTAIGLGATGGAVGGLIDAAALTARGLRQLPANTAAGLQGLPLPGAGTGAFGLSLGSSRFEAVLAFLETFGEAQVLSSPRIATLNNQRALLKVGSDDYFITGVSSSTTSTSSTATSATTVPSLTLTPFFSGIALDVMPQIDDAQQVILHIHPTVSAVEERTRQISLGSAGTLTLPLASSNINQTDTIVRVSDGQIVAIGGLMQAEARSGLSGLPGASAAGFWRNLLGNQKRTARKRELVILIKPTIIRSDQDWARNAQEAGLRLERLQGQLRDAPPARLIQLPGPLAEPVPPKPLP